ncbi:MAG: hypothetical protein WBA23_23495 [Tunicatimonas sp.]|uniref:hypothetical protein n=1 Tax=Tunicatimonas sp. TaxID=1940096 RepID=UPI003C71D986
MNHAYCYYCMTAIELKSRVYQQIAELGEPQLKKLNKLLNKEFSSQFTGPTRTDKKRPLGNMSDKIWMTGDRDSDEVNEEIARLINDGPVFPEKD